MPDSPFLSPWLAQLKQEREHFRLVLAPDSDITVVGAGIAGVSTAYYLLTHTNQSVLLIDAGRIAHGATGHNAGQVVTYFERALSDIVKEYGVEKAVHGQYAIESAWDLLTDIQAACHLRTPLYPCTGYAGYSTIPQILTQLEEMDIRASTGLHGEPVLITVDPALMKQIPTHLHRYLMQVPHSMILKALETEDPSFIAAEVTRKGCMNSALFCEELVAWMVAKYGTRITVAEHLPVTKVILDKNDATLETTGPTIKTKRVVLCTNGFENFTIENNSGSPIDPAFHFMVAGVTGYMAGYLDEPDQTPMAVSYYRQQMSFPYHYLTRRPYERADEQSSLVCIGGPERIVPDRAAYDSTSLFPADIEEELDRELRRTYLDLPPPAKRAFLWHGLMGYTNDNIRKIGYEPRNPVLLYNLGCNGVGILPSVFGGKRIAQLLSGLDLPPSIFDPRGE